MPTLKTSSDRVLFQVGQIIGNCQRNEQIMEALATKGYTAEHFAEAEDLLEQAIEAKQLQSDTYGNMYSAYDTLDESRTAAQKAYGRIVRTARLAFEKDRGSLRKLGLLEKRSNSFVAWIAQATAFYKAALSDDIIRAGLNRCGATEQEIKEAQHLAETSHQDFNTHSQLATQAKQSTKQRKDIMKQIEQWRNDLRTSAKMALRGNQPLFDEIGFNTPEPEADKPASEAPPSA